MEEKTETLKNGTRVFCGGAAPITTDALLLAAFCAFKPGEAVCDLGSGCGILLLSLLDAGLEGPAVGVEQDPQSAALLQKAAEENGFANLSAVCADLRAYRSPHLFDVVVTNPPYYTAGALPKNGARAAARHQLPGCSIEEVAGAARRLLKDGGRLYLCWPPAQLASLFAALYNARLAPKKMQLVRKTAESAPFLLLLQARKAGGEGLEILPDLLLPNGSAPGRPTI